MLMMAMTIFFSVISTGMMSYLAMSTQLGPWISPVFAVVCMVFLIPFIKSKWFYEHAVVAISSGSVGGMVGIALGLSLPSFYFLHKELFLSWLHEPIKFCAIIFSFVIIAGLYAFFLGYFLQHYFVKQSEAKFPVSQLVYDVIFIDVQKKSHHLMLSGLGVATLWNSFMMYTRSVLIAYSFQFHMFPLLLAVGFVAGMVIAFPVFIGLMIRLFALDIIHMYIGSAASSHSFLISFCTGMLIFAFLHMIYLAWKNRKSQKVHDRNSFWRQKMKKLDIVQWYFFLIAIIFVLLHSFNASIMTCLYTLFAVAWISKYLVELLAEIGTVEVDSYVWFVLLPLIYMATPTSVVVVAVAVFSTLALGLTVDFVFSYKLADLAKISYQKIVKYQIIALFCAAISAGLFFLIFCKTKGLESFALAAPKAHELDAIIRFGYYDFKVFFAGMLCASLVLLLTSELLVVVGAVLMTPFMASVLLIGGMFAHLVSNREQWYPMWFGVYAGHMLWLIVQFFS